MRLARLTPTNKHTIYMPRWHDRVVLVADYKIGIHNTIVFPQAPTLPGEWYISGMDAKAHPIEFMKTKSGGNLAMRVIPLDDLEPLERVNEKETNTNPGKAQSLDGLQPVHSHAGLPEVQPKQRPWDLRDLPKNLSLF